MAGARTQATRRRTRHGHRGAGEVLLQRGTRPDDPRWVRWFDEGEFHSHAGACQLDLGNPRRADFHLDKAREGVAPTWRRDYATYLIRRAHVQNDLGNADQAGDLLHQAIPLIEQVPSQHNLGKLLAVRDRLPDDTRRSDLDQRLSALTA
ncbi:hypothetical protein [Streptosporangium sp. NPDC001681]|uniref:hypothetical protein n=1 Tax=Streptosporangium sp. NPDC001681 TaxID=3154395 RepID=UPI0033250FF2